MKAVAHSLCFSFSFARFAKAVELNFVASGIGKKVSLIFNNKV